MNLATCGCMLTIQDWSSLKAFLRCYAGASGVPSAYANIAHMLYDVKLLKPRGI